MKESQIGQINRVIKKYFEENSSVKTVLAKDLMPNFIEAGIFEKDQKKGLPIRNILRGLDKVGSLHLIPYVRAERKRVNTNWFFVIDNKEAKAGT